MPLLGDCLAQLYCARQFHWGGIDMVQVPTGWYCDRCCTRIRTPRFRLSYRGTHGREIPPAPPLCPYCQRTLIYVVDTMVESL